MRTTHLGLTLLLLVIIGTACAAPPPGTAPAPSAPLGQTDAPSTPKRLVAAIRGDPKSLSAPITGAAGGSSTAGVPEIEHMLNVGLLSLDHQGELHLLLAEQVPTLENGLWRWLREGRMETTWRLKPDLQWHDGKPISADDFLFTATVVRDRSLPCGAAQVGIAAESVITSVCCDA